MSQRPIEGRAIPTLPSLAMDQTQEFYQNLGFEEFRQYDDYMILVRGPVELHFWACDDRSIAESSGCYIRLNDGVDALYRDFEEAGVESLGPLENKPWGMREFHLIDPSGNLIRIGQPVLK